jgi:signal transduction histidine kinase
MNLETDQRQTMLSWLFVGALIVLCGVLGVLQYRWIGEVTDAARDRLRAGLQANLGLLSREFNSEMNARIRELVATDRAESGLHLERQIAARYQHAKSTAQGAVLFRRIAIAEPAREQFGGPVILRILNSDGGVFEPAAWPENWMALKNRIQARISPGPGGMAGHPGMPAEVGDSTLVPFPVFGPEQPGPPGAHRFPREVGWVILEVDLPYIREVLLPELLHRHLESGGSLDYLVAVQTRTMPPASIWISEPAATGIGGNPDASVALFDPDSDFFFGPGPRGHGPGPPPMHEARGAPNPNHSSGRWQMLVRHRAGSLEAVVRQTRWRNLAVTGGILMLLAITVGALVRFTGRAQKLAQLQMNFVAGVSHELRTPLTVIHTAAYNLRGPVAQNPAQVERYGQLIQQESGRLKQLVEQVLSFASARAGHVIRSEAEVSLERVIEESLQSSASAIQAGHCTIEKSIEPGLPPVTGDLVALKHALENLLSNAVKHGPNGNNRIGISARRTGEGGHLAVEIRIADDGPGIPDSERERIFDPFFRGRRALEQHVHGTGLGLNLVKKIVEAHGGTIRLNSGRAEGAEFILRLPVRQQEATG